MEPKETNDQMDNFIKLQKEIMESFIEDVGSSVQQLDELYKFFDHHFSEFHQKENLRVILMFVHRCIKIWINRKDYLKYDVGISMVYFLTDHRNNEKDLNIALQIVYQIMNSIKHFGKKDVLITQKFLHILISILDGIESRTLVSNCIACIQIYVNIFPESHNIFSTLWSNLRIHLETSLKYDIQDAKIDILILLIDDFKSINTNFYQEPTLINTIQHLLKSNQRLHRKSAYYLLKKMLQYLMENIATTTMWRSKDHNKTIETFWITYITIMENLEEEQFHLILPSLENLKNLAEFKYLQTWLEILYMRILTHNNNLVLRWAVEFILKNFSCSELSIDILKYFLQATNTNLLYNYEGYFLNEELFNNFLKNNLRNLFILLPEIENWKSVPLYMLLENLNKSILPKHLTYEGVLKISACVKKLQNSRIRKEAIKICNELFKVIIDNMSMEEYVLYIETLYNVSDDYKEHETFFAKKISLIRSKSQCTIFKQRFYEIFINNKWQNNILLSFLNDVQIGKHGWLKFAPFQFELKDCDRKIIKNLYKLDLNYLKIHDLQTFINSFENSLLDMTSYDEEMICHQAAMSQYIYEISDLKIIDENIIRYILNYGINTYAVGTFARKLLENSNNKIDLWYINELIKYADKEVYEQVFDYLTRVYGTKVADEYAIKMFDIVKDKFTFKCNKLFCENNLLKHCTNLFLQRETSHGDARIEEAFSFHRFNHIRYLFTFTTIISQVSKTHEQFIINLLNYHIELTKKNPQYLENSNEHRIKMRIAFCIYSKYLNRDYVMDDVLDLMWKIVLNESNQINIIYFYEITLGFFENRGNFIINKLKEAQNLSSNQVVSIISITYGYFLLRDTTAELKNKVVSYLLAFTMGDKYQLSIMAQISLYKLLKLNKFKRIESRQQIINSIEYAAGKKIMEFLDDIRFQLHQSPYFNIFHTILFITNAPFDEFCIDIYDPDDSTFERIKNFCEKFMKKIKSTKSDDIANPSINYQIQRNMNPINDVTEPHNLIIYPTEEKSPEIYVIASLIYKLPNLDSIAKACKILGIQNLVMDSKMHNGKSVFKNLSMTSEKYLNIIEVLPKDLKEFIMTKKLEGFSIVGAEQTNKSQSFEDFKFPQKCILLLGHELDGIPVQLLGLLDYAVEMPQFGQIHTLNVHLTGSLYMLEYCKQHLIQNN